MQVISSIFWAVVLFSILVFIHEGGHFLMARLFGVRVPEFMIGLPGPKISFKKNGTRYGVTAVPLGGYVNIAGMEPGPEDPLLGDMLDILASVDSLTVEEAAQRLEVSAERAQEALEILVGWDVVSRSEEDDQDTTYNIDEEFRDAASKTDRLNHARKGTYRALSYPKKVTVLLAGITVNILTSILIFVIVLSAWGMYQPTTVISGVAKGGPAATSGVLANDKIVGIGEKKTPTWDDVIGVIGKLSPGDKTEITIERKGESYTYPITVGSSESDKSVPILGIMAGEEKYKPSIGESFKIAIENVILVGKTVFQLFNPAKFSSVLGQSTSIVGIAVIANDAAKSGPLAFAGLVAAISLSLGIMNLLPLPPLDGGKLLIETLQVIFRREFPRRVHVIISSVGVALLLALFVYLTYSDILRIFF